MKNKLILTIMLSVLAILSLSGFKLASTTKGYPFPVGTKSLATKPPIYLFSLGGEGMESRQEAFLKGPMGVAVSPEGKIYVADTGNSLIRVYSSKGEFLSTFGKGSIGYPLSIIVFESRVYVADPNSMKVAVFDEEGKELKPLLSNENPSLPTGQSRAIRPSGIQRGLDGNFYITDIGNHCLWEVSPQGEIVQRIGDEGIKDGNFKYPNGLWITSDGKMYVSDSNNRRIQIFDERGQFLYKINGSYGKSGAFSLPRGIAVTEQGVILVVDVFSHKVRAFDTTGMELWSFGGLGSLKENFNFPNGIYWDEFSSRLYVTDRENNRVQVFGFQE